MGVIRKAVKVAACLSLVFLLFVSITSPAPAEESEAPPLESKDTSEGISESTADTGVSPNDAKSSEILPDSGESKGKQTLKNPISTESNESVSSFMSAASLSSTGGADEAGGADIAAPVPDSYEFSGAAMHTIPIQAPPGRNGIRPDLNLTYNSYQKNGWIGVGWDLEVGAIQRSTKKRHRL